MHSKEKESLLWLQNCKKCHNLTIKTSECSNKVGKWRLLTYKKESIEFLANGYKFVSDIPNPNPKP